MIMTPHVGLFFSVEEIAAAQGISRASARVFCHRKTVSGEFLRVKRNVYVRSADFAAFGERERFGLSNLLQTPSYVSLSSALSFLGLSTQILSSTVEAVNPVRSRSFTVSDVVFRFYYVPEERYFGFVRRDSLFMAEPEKALLDALSLQAFGRYRLDEAALDLKGIRWNLIEKWLRKYPPRIRNYLKQWRKDRERSRTA